MTNEKPKSRRCSGILLHPTSLPGPYGIGDIGPSAHAWIDILARTGQTWWQVLPLGPTGFGDSPYQCFSAFAGNPYLISPQALLKDGLLRDSDLHGLSFPTERVDYGPVIQFKNHILFLAWENYRAKPNPSLRAAFDEFCTKNMHWLDDFALFMAIKDAHGGKSWLDWGDEARLRSPQALAKARRDLELNIGLHQFRQFLFFRQWIELKQHALERGVRLMGDAPIFVSTDSADVWANPELFQLDKSRKPTVVAGVPPDYFSATGQLWGNPLYNWEALKKTGYAWWIARLKATLNLVDLVRLDHFRGFEAYWEIPASAPTAETGRWVKGPGRELFEVVQGELKGLPIIAEDLGLITTEVEELRDHFRLPGMRILQFAFGGAVEDRFLPHNYEHNTVVYTGTHDNDTTLGWFRTLSEHEGRFLRRYLPNVDQDPAWNLIRLAWSSTADYALTPLQDILSLGTEARMNYPGRAGGNWSWRYRPDMLHDGVLGRLSDFTDLFARWVGR